VSGGVSSFHTIYTVSSSVVVVSFVGVFVVVIAIVGFERKSSNSGYTIDESSGVKKTGCRRRIVIKEDLGAEEQKTAGNTQSFPIFQKSCKLLGEQQHFKQLGARTSESSRTGPDAAAPPLAQSQSRERVVNHPIQDD